MSRLNSSTGVIIGAIMPGGLNWELSGTTFAYYSNIYGSTDGESWGPWKVSNLRYQYVVSYMGKVLPAHNETIYQFHVGDTVIIDRRIPQMNLAIVGKLFGDGSEGTPYDGKGGAIGNGDGGRSSPPGPGSTLPPGGSAVTGWFRFDSGPGFGVGVLHP